MASNQTGRATIFGFAGTISWSGIGTLYKESGDFASEFKLDRLMDEDNEPQGFIGSGEMYKAGLLFTPVSSGSTIAAAKLSLEPPAKLARVTLTSFAWATANSATWVYVGGWKIAFKKDGLATYALNIEKSPLRDLSTPVS
jgi:hypothetical protein